MIQEILNNEINDLKQQCIDLLEKAKAEVNISYQSKKSSPKYNTSYYLGEIARIENIIQYLYGLKRRRSQSSDYEHYKFI